MTHYSPTDLSAQLGSGVLSFPVTHFDEAGDFHEDAFARHCAWLLEHDVAGLFAAGGTGEFFSLTPSEVSSTVRTAVQVAEGRRPVIAGCGHGTATATEMAREAERVGADGILLLPPYLVVADQEGLLAHVEAVCRATGLGVVLYGRDNAVFETDTLARLCDRNPNLVGYKDGIGDLELMTRIVARTEGRLVHIGGLPTAETFALPYLTLGVATYSSAILNFMPAWALAFYRAVRAGDRPEVMRRLREFVIPFIGLRNRRRGYAVSIVKAGLSAVGRDAGPVRPPLTPLSRDEEDELRRLIDANSR